jgi:hypothetical protein
MAHHSRMYLDIPDPRQVTFYDVPQHILACAGVKCNYNIHYSILQDTSLMWRVNPFTLCC